MNNLQTWLDQLKAMKPGDISRISMFDAFKMREDGTLRIIATDTDGKEVITNDKKRKGGIET